MTPRVATVAGLLALWASPALANAQGTGRDGDGARVTVVRQTHPSVRRVADLVDPVLLRELERTAGMIEPNVSPIDFGEIRLAAGCSDEAAPCLAAVARVLDASAIVLRQVDRDGDGRARITIVHHVRASDAVPARVTYSDSDPEGLVRRVPGLVRRLFASPEARDLERDGPSIGAATWLSLGSGVVLVATASVLGVMANDAQHEYASIDVQTRSDAERAVDALSSAEGRALAANVLFVAGGIALGLGATLMVLDLAGDQDDERPARSLAVLPVRSGAVVMLGGSMDGT